MQNYVAIASLPIRLNQIWIAVEKSFMKLASEVQNTFVKIPIVLGID